MQSLIYLTLVIAAANGRFVEYDAAVKAWETGTPMVVILSAEWCGPCKSLKAEAAKLTGVSVVVLDVDRDKIAERFPRVQSLPTVYVFRRFHRTQTIVGNDTAKLRKALE